MSWRGWKSSGETGDIIVEGQWPVEDAGQPGTLSNFATDLVQIQIPSCPISPPNSVNQCCILPTFGYNARPEDPGSAFCTGTASVTASGHPSGSSKATNRPPQLVARGNQTRIASPHPPCIRSDAPSPPGSQPSHAGMLAAPTPRLRTDASVMRVMDAQIPVESGRNCGVTRKPNTHVSLYLGLNDK